MRVGGSDVIRREPKLVCFLESFEIMILWSEQVSHVAGQPTPLRPFSSSRVNAASIISSKSPGALFFSLSDTFLHQGRTLLPAS